MQNKSKATKLSNILLVKIKDIDEPKFIVRSEIGKAEIEALSLSISNIGLLEPIIVFKVKNKYEIVAGHRRYKACKYLGLTEVECRVIDEKNSNVELIKLHENMERENINAYDEAKFLQHIAKKNKFNQKQLAKFIGKTEPFVTMRLAILNYDEDMQEALYKNKINVSVARELDRIDNKNIRKEYLRYALDNGCSSTIMKNWADNYLAFKDNPADLKALEQSDYNSLAKHKIMVQCFVSKEMFAIEDTNVYRIANIVAKELQIIE